jgi:hypothetical protein
MFDYKGVKGHCNSFVQSCQVNLTLQYWPIANMGYGIKINHLRSVTLFPLYSHSIYLLTTYMYIILILLHFHTRPRCKIRRSPRAAQIL